MPAPVVSGMPIGITAAEITCEKPRSVFSSATGSAGFIIPKPVLISSRPPAMRKAGMVMSKNERIAMPASIEVSMVTKAVNVAIRQSRCCSCFERPWISPR